MTTIASQFAEQLLSVQCIKVQPTQPFTWASGWLSPFYCDNRKTLAYPQVRTFVKEQLAALIRRQYPEATAIAGVATGAIAQGALVADELGLPMCYVRSKAKDHGMGNLIEGTLPEGARIVVVEDLISTGGSSLKAVEALRAAGFEILGMVASFTYGFPVAAEAFAAAGVTRSLTSIFLLLDSFEILSQPYDQIRIANLHPQYHAGRSLCTHGRPSSF